MSAPVYNRIVSKRAQTYLIPVMFVSIVNLTAGLRLTNMSAPAVADPRSDMNLDCHFDMGAEELYAVKWYKDDQEFFRYLPHHQPQEMTFPVTGVHTVLKETSCTQKRCKILLTDLRREHSGGAYRCEISSEAPAFRLASETHNIIVAALPKENPRIEGLADSYHVGDTLTAECVSSEADPTPVLMWHINKNQAPPNTVGNSISSPPDKRGLSSRSLSLRFQVERKYTQGNFMELSCVSSLPGVPVPPQSVDRRVHVRSEAHQVNNEKLHWPNASAKRALHLNCILTIAIVNLLFK